MIKWKTSRAEKELGWNHVDPDLLSFVKYPGEPNWQRYGDEGQSACNYIYTHTHLCNAFGTNIAAASH